MEDLKKFCQFELEKFKPCEDRLHALQTEISENCDLQIKKEENGIRTCQEQLDNLEQEIAIRKIKLESQIMAYKKKVEELKNPLSIQKRQKELDKLYEQCYNDSCKFRKIRSTFLENLDFDKLDFENTTYTISSVGKIHKINPSYKYKGGAKIMKDVKNIYPDVPVDTFVKNKGIKMSKGKKQNPKKRRRPWELECTTRRKKIKT